jgi:Cu/Zn superoxide dismutase
LPALAGAACSDDGEGEPATQLHANIESRSGSTLYGDITFTPQNGTVFVSAYVHEAPRELVMLGLHIHEHGDCGAPESDASAAGDHWNPDGQSHGRPATVDSHLGDVGNITVDIDRNGLLKQELPNRKWTFASGRAATDLRGRSVVVHELEDTWDPAQANEG